MTPQDIPLTLLKRYATVGDIISYSYLVDKAIEVNISTNFSEYDVFRLLQMGYIDPLYIEGERQYIVKYDMKAAPKERPLSDLAKSLISGYDRARTLSIKTFGDHEKVSKLIGALAAHGIASKEDYDECLNYVEGIRKHYMKTKKSYEPRINLGLKNYSYYVAHVSIKGCSVHRSIFYHEHSGNGFLLNGTYDCMERINAHTTSHFEVIEELVSMNIKPLE